MPDRDATTIVALFGLPADLVEMRPGRIEVEVEMEIDVEVELPGEVEDAREMRVRIGVRIRAAADRIGSLAQGLNQQLFSPGIVGQAFLREDAKRQIDRPGVIALEPLDRFEAAQTDARVDLDMGTHPRRAVDDGALEHLCAACIDIVDAEIPLHRRNGTDGITERAVDVPAAFEQARLVEMDVGVDEAGQGQPPPDIDLDRLAGQPGFDCGNTSALHANIDGRRG